MAQPDPQEDRPVCDGCFLECRPRRNGSGRAGSGKWVWLYPCSPELREWAKAHRDSPGFVAESLRDVRPIKDDKEA